MNIRSASANDAVKIGEILMPIFLTGETYALPRDISLESALAYWFSPGHQVFVLENDDGIVGTYYLRANQAGGGSHVANAAFAVCPNSRGVGGRLCAHALDVARATGFTAMQFNFVVSTNARAISLWRRYNFEIVGTLPDAFQHPLLGLVDAFVMFRRL